MRQLFTDLKHTCSISKTGVFTSVEPDLIHQQDIIVVPEDIQ